MAEEESEKSASDLTFSSTTNSSRSLSGLLEKDELDMLSSEVVYGCWLRIEQLINEYIIGNPILHTIFIISGFNNVILKIVENDWRKIHLMI